MSESTILDVLLGAIIVLVALIGYWQGVVRSLLVICGGLIGSELALWWSDELGDWLADILPINDDTGRFIASTALILGASLLLGVLLGNMVSRPVTAIRDRLSGIAVSLVSAVLIIGLVIRYFHIHMADRAASALSDTVLANALWEQFDWIVLASALGGVALLVLFWILGAPETAQGADSRSVQAPAWSVAPQTKIGKSGRRSRLEPVQPSSNNDYAVYGANDGGGASRGQPSIQTQPREDFFAEPESKHVDTGRAEAKSDLPADNPTKHASAAQHSGSASAAFERQYAPVADTLSFSNDSKSSEDFASSGICPNCGMLLTSGDQFCPDCGKPID